MEPTHTSNSNTEQTPAQVLQLALAAHQKGALPQACTHYAQYFKLRGIAESADAEYTHANYLYAAALLATGVKANAQTALPYIILAAESATKTGTQNPAYTACLGHIHHTLGNAVEAKQAWEATLAINPLHTEALCCLVEQALDTGSAKEALALCKRAHIENETAQSNPFFLRLYGQALVAEKEHKHAKNILEQSLKLSNTDPLAHFTLGIALEALNHNGIAADAFKMAIELSPKFAKAYFWLGKVLLKLGKPKRALHRLTEAEALGLHTEALHVAMGKAHNKPKLKQYTKAIQAFHKALTLNEGNVAAWVGIGEALKKQKKVPEAIAALEKAIALAPENIEALVGLASAYMDYPGGMQARSPYINLAIPLNEKIEKLDGENAAVQFHLGNFWMACGLPHKSIPHHEKAIALDNENINSESVGLFNINYLPEADAPATEIYNQHKVWGQLCMKRHGVNSPVYNAGSIDKNPHKKLRIGYVSADLCVHPVGYFFRPVFENHNRADFEIYCYANHRKTAQNDEYAGMFIEGCQKTGGESGTTWRHVKDLNDAALAQQIKADGIDILVDMSGHSSGHRLNVFAAKPAPVQVSWMAYPNTTGLPSIDARFSDAITEPAELTDHLSTEKIVRLPNGFHTYKPSYQFPEPAQAPPILKNGHITFGSFNNTCKISQATIGVWARLLNTVEGSKLVLKDKFLMLEYTRNYIINQFEKHGTDVSRIEFLGFTKTNIEHLNCYAQMDVALDPFPYNGTTTTCEALYMGVPVLTLQGCRHASRVTGSLVTRVGLADWVSETEEGYIEKASQVAKQPELIANLRTNLRTQFLESPLGQDSIVTKDMEAAYRELWQAYCAKA